MWLFHSTLSLPQVTCSWYPAFFMLSSHSCSCFRTGWLCSTARLLSPATGSGSAALHSSHHASSFCKVNKCKCASMCRTQSVSSICILLFLAEGRKWIYKGGLLWFGIILYVLRTHQCEFTAGSEHNKFKHYQHRYIFTEQSIVSTPHSLCLINVHIQHKSGRTFQRAQCM